MKKLLTILLAVCTISLISCKKESDNPVEPKKFTKLVKTIKSGNQTETFTYDDNQRIIRRETTPTSYITFEYNGNIVRISSVYSGKTYVSEAELENGVSTKIFAINGDTRTLEETAEYDAQGYLIKSTTPGNRTYTYTWTNGNMTKEEAGSSAYNYTYGSKPSLVNYNFVTETLYTGLEGKNNANLEESMQITSNNGMTTDYLYAYEFNAGGCPIKFTAIRNGVIEYTREITYY